jgi:hypothetical protein
MTKPPCCVAQRQWSSVNIVDKWFAPTTLAQCGQMRRSHSGPEKYRCCTAISQTGCKQGPESVANGLVIAKAPEILAVPRVPAKWTTPSGAASW